MPEIRPETVATEETAASAHADKSLSELVALAKEDATKLVRSDIALAKTEIKGDVKRGGIGAGMFVGVVIMLYFFVIFGSTAAAFAISMAGLPYAVSFGIIAGGYFVVMLILALVGIMFLRKLSKGQRTKAALQATMAVIKRPKPEEPEAA
ncbi:MAG: phage holin family protein [Streptosporangiaceae bacterium]